MRITLTALLCVLVGLTGARTAETNGIPLHETSKSLPEIAFADETGTPLTLEAWRGKVVVLNIWATWCAPCREEMPTLDRLQSRLGGDSFEVVALSIDRAGAGIVRTFFDEIGIKHLRIFIDKSGRAAHALKVPGLPATILVGPSGQELGRLVGPAEWDTPEMMTFFEDVIAKHQKRNRSHDDG